MSRLFFLTKKKVGQIASYLLYLFLLLPLSANGQVSAPLSFISELPEDLPGKKQVEKAIRKSRDSLALKSVLTEWQQTNLERGWLEADYTIKQVGYSSQYKIRLTSGSRYYVRSIRILNAGPEILRSPSLQKWFKGKTPLNWDQIENDLKETLLKYNTAGYPFASFDLEDVVYKNSDSGSIDVSLMYKYQSGVRVNIDSISFPSSIKEKKHIIHNLTDIFPGDFYDIEKISDATRLINNSIYFENAEEPEISWKDEKHAVVGLNFKRRRASNFDILLGILPPDATTDKLEFTGSADIQLISNLHLGEKIELSYRKFTSTSQRLNIDLSVPYILGLPLQGELSFSLWNQEESFLVRHFDAGGSFWFSPFLSVGLRYKNRSASLLDSTQVSTRTDLPDQIDGTHSFVAGEFRFEKLDYRITPRKGISISMGVAAGQRTSRNNPIISSDLYEQVTEKQPSREFSATWKLYWPVLQRQVIHFAQDFYWLDQEQYFQNDLLQVGGARSLRGFNENQFFTDLYLRSTAEYRLMLEKDSYIFVFGEYAYLRNEVDRKHLLARGFGLGMQYGTKAGIISLTYAVGRTNDTPLQAGRGKIHIGLVNQF